MATASRPIVLCVDDEASILDAVRLELEDDFDVATAASGSEALDLLAHRHIDAMLLDLRMPGMEGEEVLRRLRAVRSRPPVIVMTVVDKPRTVVECMKLGAADYVTKPWEHGEVVTTIQRTLREVQAPPGVLLISDDPAALVPVALALEGQVRVQVMSVATALASSFPARVVVLHAPSPSTASDLSDLAERFPDAAAVWVRDESSKHLQKTLNDIRTHLGLRTEGQQPLPRVILAAIDLMIRHWRDPFTVDEIARTVGVSKDHLIRVFREAFGLTAGGYHIRLRIAIACRLLKDTDQKMNDVAHPVGYSGAANLSRAFKEVMGIRPGEFRRSSAPDA